MFFSRPSAGMPTATTESANKMAFAATVCPDEVAELQLPPLPLSRFKGVVPQPNGRWGAHIYERSARLWLGTFPGEETAVRAYDVAARRCGRQAVANFTAEYSTNGDLAFQATHSTSEIVNTLWMHTSADEVRQSLWRGAPVQPAPWAREHLFQKALTPSDVGKLNRLVVPKQHAQKHLVRLKRPPVMAAGMGVLLDFKDGEGKMWQFRYSYWASSRIYILTKGWRRFVREKGLQAGDMVAFSRSALGPYKQMHIDYWKNQDDTTADAIAVVDPPVVMLFGVDIARGGPCR